MHFIVLFKALLVFIEAVRVLDDRNELERATNFLFDLSVCYSCWYLYLFRKMVDDSTKKHYIAQLLAFTTSVGVAIAHMFINTEDKIAWHLSECWTLILLPCILVNRWLLVKAHQGGLIYKMLKIRFRKYDIFIWLTILDIVLEALEHLGSVFWSVPVAKHAIDIFYQILYLSQLYVLVGIIKNCEHSGDHSHSILEPESLFHARKSNKRLNKIASAF
jgi:hypothetical protein